MTSPLKQLPSNDILDYGNSKTSAKDDSNIALTPHVSNIGIYRLIGFIRCNIVITFCL